MNQDLIRTATKNVHDILSHSIKFDSNTNNALVVFDTQNELTNILTEAYRACLPEAIFMDFDTTPKDQIIAKFDEMQPNDLVVLIQTGSFRLDEFRIRIHLFNRKLKVIEHMHLYRNPQKTWQSYIDSLSYDPTWYDTMGTFLQVKLTDCKVLTIHSNGVQDQAEIIMTGGLEAPKLNTGDYTNLPNIGGTFPIGEVFTEGKELSNLNGSFWIYAFANSNFEIMMPDKFRVDIKNGLVSSWSDNAPQEFIDVVNQIKTLERPIIREIGFGLNRAMSKTNPLGDITAFERIVGVHLSMGEKHSVYKKNGITTHKSRFHVDLFVDTKEVTVDGTTIFRDGEYIV